MEKFLRTYVASFYYWFLYLFYEKPKRVNFIRKYDELSKTNSSSYMYSMLSKKTLHEIFLGINIKPEDVILDIGCGKGFALYIMAKLGFNHVHGIEILQSLCNIAKKNMSTLKLENKVTIECVDATAYKNLDEYTYIYMFNPFPDEIMKKVVENIGESLKHRPRNLVIIYSNPTCHDVLADSNVLEFYDKRFVSARLGKVPVHYYRHCCTPV